MILHAHDWLVAWAARELQEACGVPLVVTIHATEYGRNKGLHTPGWRQPPVPGGLLPPAPRPP
ncbi:glycogen/starch synthase [Moorella stamsii]|uniref:glycogen/starch synthase n=1 Tax=Neomoorella stamsii TaxID=1266720 RepID=UPI00137A01C6|nr:MULTISPECIES: glycogen/starch synthase [Moorella]